MKKSAAILILETLTIKELKLFEDFVNSPFHNRNNQVIQFFNILKKHHPIYPPDKTSKEYLFKKMSGNAEYKEVFIRNLYSDLNLLAEKFLQHIHITDDYHEDKFLIEELNIRNISDTLKKKISLFEQKISLDKSRDQNYYANRVFIYNMKGLFNTDKTLVDIYSPEAISGNMKMSLITIMESYFQLVIEEQRIRIKHNFDYLVHALEYLRKNLKDFRDSPLLLVYYNLWESFFDESGEEYFLKAKKIFDRNFTSLKLMDRKNIYAVMQAFCLKKIDAGNVHFSKVLLNIMLEMLRRKVVSHREGVINLNLYRNILITCFRENEIKMLKKFISDYIHMVDRESRESIRDYSNAHLNFLEGDFKTSLELCNKIKFTSLLITTNENLYFKNDVKSLILKCLYELHSYESALCQIDAFKHFLNNSLLIKDSLKRKFMHFNNVVNKLIRLKIKFDDYGLFKLRKQVLNSRDMFGKDWILKKIDEFVV